MKQLVRIILIAFLVASCAPKSAEFSNEVLMKSESDKKETTPILKNIAESDVIKKKIIKDGRFGLS